MRIIAGTYKNRSLLSPKGLDTRPTSSMLREAIFNICQGYISEASFLDLFAGSGAIGFEALSRGAAHVSFVEKNKEAIKAIQANISALKVENQAQVIYGDCRVQLVKLAKKGHKFDIIYADPPYDQGLGEEVLKIIDESNILKPNGMCFVEEGKGVELPTQNLKHLAFINQRLMGRSTLYQYSTREV